MFSFCQNFRCVRNCVFAYGLLRACNQCLSPLLLWVRISIMLRCTTLCDEVCQWFATGQWFSPGKFVSDLRQVNGFLRGSLSVICDRSMVFSGEVCQWFATGQWFSPGSPFSFTNKTDRHEITEILLKVALSTIKQTNRLHLLRPATLSIILVWGVYGFICNLFSSQSRGDNKKTAATSGARTT
jgi:hypothetical protein